MCALLTSCDGLPLPQHLVPQDFAKCVRAMGDDLTKPSSVAYSLTIRECGLGATTCTDLRRCALRGAKADACVGRGGEGVADYCDAEGRALSCLHDKVVAVRDCPRGGEQCAVRGGEAYCALGSCPPEILEGAPPVCSASGTRVLRCQRGRLVSLDCGAFGLKCAVAGGVPGCASDTAACSSSAVRCEGAVAVGCHQGHEVRIDCRAAGLTCSPSAAPRAVGACATPESADACDPAAPARCDGASIKYCSAGRPRSVSCKAQGFTRCINDSRGIRCAP
jgi:hypothetical protein